MSETDIQKIHDLEMETLNNDRRFYTHVHLYEDTSFTKGETVDEGASPIFVKYINKLSVSQGEISTWGGDNWVEDIDSPELASLLKKLPKKDIELLTNLVVDGLTQTEIAGMRGVSSPAISKQLARIRKAMKKILEQG